ncbi:MAG TPA: TolC family protein, partial [Spirochaetia bacterium]|nr:TolC family protein [Spirochaetia bacterium]
MIRKKTVAIVTMLTLAILQLGFAQEKSATTSTSVPLTLEAAISRAVANQPLILKAEAAVAAARAGVGESQSSYFPNVSGSASYTRLEPEQTITFMGLGKFSLYQVDNYGFQIGLNQLIFASGARGLQVKLAESGLEAATIGVE